MVNSPYHIISKMLESKSIFYGFLPVVLPVTLRKENKKDHLRPEHCYPDSKRMQKLKYCNNNNKLHLGYHPVAVVILYVHKYEKKSN